MKILTKLKNIALGCSLLLSAGTTASCAAITGGPTAQITFIVKDDFGKSVEDAEVAMQVLSHRVGHPWRSGELKYNYFKAKTDKDGRAVVKGSGRYRDFGYSITDNKNYHIYGAPDNGYVFEENSFGRWEPWNPTIEIVYKPILKPVPYLGTKERNRKVLPSRTAAHGFDLFKNDWVTPYGKGERTDIVFTLEEKLPFFRNARSYDYRLKITFPNKDDGIQSCFAPVDSIELRTPRYAPTEGYSSNLELKYGLGVSGYFPKRDDQNYFFRVRTEVDEKGKIKSAIYGKIRGNIKCDVINSKTGILFFQYELNPTPLDVNMEFDREKNLLPKENR
jgi:hypothetical protein